MGAGVGQVGEGCWCAVGGILVELGWDVDGFVATTRVGVCLLMALARWRSEGLCFFWLGRDVNAVEMYQTVSSINQCPEQREDGCSTALTPSNQRRLF